MDKEKENGNVGAIEANGHDNDAIFWTNENCSLSVAFSY